MTLQPIEISLVAMFQNHAGLLGSALELLRDCTADTGQPADVTFSEIRKLERQGADMLRSTFRELDHQIVDYPLRETARRVFYHFDRTVDVVEVAIGRLAACRLGRLPDPAIRLVNVLVTSAEVLSDVIQAFKEAKHFSEQVAGMSQLRSEADQIYVDAVRELFEDEKDAIRLIKLDGVYGLLERIGSLFEDLIHAMEDAAHKMSPSR